MSDLIACIFFLDPTLDINYIIFNKKKVVVKNNYKKFYVSTIEDLNRSLEGIEPLKINLGGSYITGEEEDNWDINIGLKYVM